MTWPYIAIIAGAIALLAPVQAVPQPNDKPPPLTDTNNPGTYHRLTGHRIIQYPDIADLYPDHAMRNDIPGKVKLHCVLKPDRELHDCAVVEEAPLGEGFGAATLRLATGLRIEPLQVDGKPLDEEKVEFPMSWKTQSP